MKHYPTILQCLALIAFCAHGFAVDSTNPPEPKREFRGVWIATVDNINWPSKPGLSVTAQKAELITLLDAAKAIHLNAIILQVRPAADAFYKSSLEPWSEYLTGTMGKAPAPEYDPLSYAIDAAHRRGLELHAWVNPFRALHSSSESPIAANHISRKRPDLVHRYGSQLWLDPGEPAARDHSLKVILDIVRRYDIDGIHFDDYFYPYPERDSRGGNLPFPDGSAWKTYGQGTARADWRRQNVDNFVQQVQKSVHAEKPWVQFGISPFGIWRPGYPESVAGMDAYDVLHADARKWLREGWVDYLIPQLYWSIDSPRQSFPLLLQWWKDQNRKHRHLWPGLAVYKVGGAWNDVEIIRQIDTTRKLGINGETLYHIGALQDNPTLTRQLTAGPYRQLALTPQSPWLGDNTTPQPSVEMVKGQQTRIRWKPTQDLRVKCWLLQTKSSSGWRTTILPASSAEYPLTNSALSTVSLRAVDRFGNLSSPVVLPVNP